MAISRQTLHPQGDSSIDIYPKTDANQIDNDLFISQSTPTVNEQVVRRITTGFSNTLKQAQVNIPLYTSPAIYFNSFTNMVKTAVRALAPIEYLVGSSQTYVVLYALKRLNNLAEYMSLDGSVHVVINTQDWSIEDVHDNVV